MLSEGGKQLKDWGGGCVLLVTRQVNGCVLEELSG